MPAAQKFNSHRHVIRAGGKALTKAPVQGLAALRLYWSTLTSFGQLLIKKDVGKDKLREEVPSHAMLSARAEVPGVAPTQDVRHHLCMPGQP